MGIKGLLNFFQDKFEIKSIKLLKNNSVCIDGHSWLHKSCSLFAEEYCINNNIVPIINYFKYKIEILKNNNISILFIFDGDSYPLKRELSKKRKADRLKNKEKALMYLKQNNLKLAVSYFKRCIEITPSLLLNVFNSLKEFYKENKNIKFMISPYEADAQMVYFQLNKKVDYIITEDSDLILYGAKKIIYKYDNKNFNYWDTDRIFKEYNIDMLRKVCILNGCDYINGIKGIGLKKSLKLIQDLKNIKLVIKKLREENYVVEDNYIENFNYALLSFEFQKIFCLKINNITYLNPPINSKYKKKLAKMINIYGSDCFLGEGFKDEYEIIKLINGLINPFTKEDFKFKNFDERISKIKSSVESKSIKIIDNKSIKIVESKSIKIKNRNIITNKVKSSSN